MVSVRLELNVIIFSLAGKAVLKLFQLAKFRFGLRLGKFLFRIQSSLFPVVCVVEIFKSIHCIFRLHVSLHYVCQIEAELWVYFFKAFIWALIDHFFKIEFQTNLPLHFFLNCVQLVYPLVHLLVPFRLIFGKVQDSREITTFVFLITVLNFLNEESFQIIGSCNRVLDIFYIQDSIICLTASCEVYHDLVDASLP